MPACWRRPGGVDRDDPSVGLGRADQRGPQRPGEGDVVDVRPRPVISRGSSLRRMAWPTWFDAGAWRWSAVYAATSLISAATPPPPTSSSLMTRLRIDPPLHLGGVEHRLDDVVVAGATAQVALQPVADLLLGGVGVLGQQAGGGHDHPRGAVAALEAMVVPEGLLDRMELAVRGHALDRGDLRAVGLHGQDRARLHGLAVQVDRAGAAVGRVAAHVGAGQTKLVAQGVDQQHTGLDLQLVLDSIDVETHRNGVLMFRLLLRG